MYYFNVLHVMHAFIDYYLLHYLPVAINKVLFCSVKICYVFCRLFKVPKYK